MSTQESGGDTSSVPLQMGDEEVERYDPEYEYPYVIRLTPKGDDKDEQRYSYEDVLEFITENFDKWILAEELRPRPHFHIYLEYDKDIKNVKELIREFIYPFYPDRKRGFGGAHYNIQYSERPLKGIRYALKQKSRMDFSGFQEEFIEQQKDLSFEKKGDAYNKDFLQLEQDFFENKIDPYEYGALISELNATHDRQVQWKQIQGIVMSKIIKKDKNKSIYYARKYLEF